MIQKAEFDELKPGQVIIGQHESQWLVLSNEENLGGVLGSRAITLEDPLGNKIIVTCLDNVIYNLTGTEIWALNGPAVRIEEEVADGVPH